MACPLSAILCGELAASSLKTRVADWYGPVPAGGEKLTCTVQAAPTASVALAQVSADRLQSASASSVVQETCSAVVPSFVKVAVWLAVVPARTSPNAMELGLAVACGLVPVPERAIVCGDPGASSAMESDPENRPVAVGAKSTWIVQVEPGATAVFEQRSVTIANGVPTAAWPMFSVSVPELVRTTCWLADVVPTTSLPNARLDGSDAAG